MPDVMKENVVSSRVSCSAGTTGFCMESLIKNTLCHKLEIGGFPVDPNGLHHMVRDIFYNAAIKTFEMTVSTNRNTRFLCRNSFN
jgi:hypothetical protein